MMSKFVATVVIWAFICLIIYVALRYGQKRAPIIVSTLGGFAFVIQAVLLCGFVLLILAFTEMPISGPNPPPALPPDIIFAVEFTLGVLAVWLAPLLLGACIMRLATEKRGSWGAQFLFCAALLCLSNGASWFVLLRLHLFYDAMHIANSLGGSARLRESLLTLFMWAFPLGAPLAEIIFNSFKRAHQTKPAPSFEGAGSRLAHAHQHFERELFQSLIRQRTFR